MFALFSRSNLGRLAAAAAVLVAAGCQTADGPDVQVNGGVPSGPNGPGQPATLTVLLTDAPGEALDSAVVSFSQIVLLGTDGSRYVISDTAQSHDLLTLTNGVTAELGSASIPAGDYQEIRVVIDSARAVLTPPTTFQGGSGTMSMKVPSGSTSGLKVKFDGDTPLTIVPGETVVVIDFDISRSFVFQGPPGRPRSVSLKPVIRATYRDVAGSISGVVTPADAGATVYAIRAVDDTVATADADPVTGAYSLQFLPPGSYTVAASATGFAPEEVAVDVGEAEDVTGVDFDLTPNASISGTVAPAAAGATVYVIALPSDTVGSAMADGTTGDYTVGGLLPGTYSVVASASGYGDEQVDDVAVGPSEAVAGVDFTLTPDGSISGTVMPLGSGATLYAIILPSDTVATATADGTTGSYTLGGLLPGTYSVAASASGFQPSQVDGVMVAPSEAVVGVDFTLSP